MNKQRHLNLVKRYWRVHCGWSEKGLMSSEGDGIGKVYGIDLKVVKFGNKELVNHVLQKGE